MYIDINKTQVEQTTNIATNREEFVKGGFIELTEELEAKLNGDANFDILNYVFPKGANEPNLYLKKGRGVVAIKGKLNPAMYSVGTTWQDYLKGRFVLLNAFQEVWYKDHNDATDEEIFNMTIIDKALEVAKQSKINEITRYDSSAAVNSVTINGVSTWLTVQERANYNSSITAAESFGLTEVSFFVADAELTVDINQAKQMLAAIQLYADACFIVTKQHMLAVNSLTTVQEVLDYDYTTGYPERPNFTLQRASAVPAPEPTEPE